MSGYNDRQFMMLALLIAKSDINKSNKYPFGTVVVKENRVIGRGRENTIEKKDPTAHAEIEAIRNACESLNTVKLNGCIVFTSSEPCEMCISAMYWAGVEKVYYACSREDVYGFGLPDRFDLVRKREEGKEMLMHQICREEGLEVFRSWKDND